MALGDLFRKRYGVDPKKLDLIEIDNIAFGKRQIDFFREEFENRFDKVLENPNSKSRKEFFDFVFKGSKNYF